ncbi:hypothetical protein MACH09_46950 [Vibrio sp. MACH09]|nr:hypothetical protein MACH09_46950 [Vibrio sp. MACH09]
MNLKPIWQLCRQITCFILILLSTTASSKDFGIIGSTFPIGEVDMLLWIEQRLKNFEKTGKLADMQTEFQSRVQNKVNNPTPIPIGTTTNPQTFYVNPSMTFPGNVVDPRTKKVIAANGQTINPFDSSTWPKESSQAFPKFRLSKVLLFLDARDPRQRAFAKSFTHELPIKYILTGGNLNDTAELLGARIYFAQDGYITNKLHIKHVPSLAYQEGTRWRIDEFDVSSYPEDEKPSN